jgi:uncharacterized heparinase superfamily protein
MRRLLLLFHTLRYLKPVQIYGRIWFKIYKPSPGKSHALSPASIKGAWVQPPLRPQCLTGQATFYHLNEEHTLPLKCSWRIREASLLWNYHLHYFDDLVSEGFQKRRHWHAGLIKRWIGENIPGSSPGWEPYPLSRRIINWIKAEMAGPVLETAALDSLVLQTRHLIKKQEHHLQGNHLWINAKAMIFAGLFFGGCRETGEARRWLARGLRLADQQLREQMMPDGSHFEQSPMYHALMTEDVLDLINIGRAFAWKPAEAWCAEAGKMLGYLRAVCHPDRQLALFNDSAMNMTPVPDALLDYGQNLGIRPVTQASGSSGGYCFSDSGLVRVDQGGWSLFFDAGPIGPDYIPGHAHADNLTIELSLYGKRLIVDTGTGIYGTGDKRIYQRSTAAHNTIRVDKRDSSEVWSGFRVARRARPTAPPFVAFMNGQIVCRGGHDGYVRLAGKVIHERSIRVNTEEVIVQDDLKGQGVHRVELFLHFHPDYTLVEDAAGWLVTERGTAITRARIIFGGIDHCRKERYEYSPEFGLFITAEKLRAVKQTRIPWKLQTVIIKTAIK